MRAAVLLLCGCEALSGVVSLGTNRPKPPNPDRPDAETRDAEPEDAAVDAGELDAEVRRSELAISFLSDPPQAIEPGGSFDVEVTIENRGTVASTETTIRFELAAAATLGEPFIGAIDAGANESRRFRVIVPTSTAGAHRLRAIVDPQNVVPELDEDNNDAIAGRVLVGALVVLPQSLDLSTPFGCVRAGLLSIENRSARRADAIDLSLAGSVEFTVSPPTASLAPGSAITATVSYSPIDRSLDRAVLVIGNDLGSAVTIELSGDGDDRPRTETFQQFAARKVDLLFVVDNSCSMDEEQARLGERFAAFLDFAETETIDYRIAVTTTDLDDGGGRFVGTPKIIDPSTPNAGEAFAANAMVGLDGAPSEQGMRAAQLALSPPLIEADNAGFLRPEASLAIVYVSDEDDQSPGDISDYAAFFSALRPSPFLRINAIVGDTPNGCATAGPGWRYRALVDLIGGVTTSICTSDWDQTLIALAAGGFGFRTRFALAGSPVPSTIEIEVNGQPLGPEFWSYVETSNAIEFDPFAVPEAASEILVSYTPGCP